jgi:hypothetical protein
MVAGLNMTGQNHGAEWSRQEACEAGFGLGQWLLPQRQRSFAIQAMDQCVAHSPTYPIQQHSKSCGFASLGESLENLRSPQYSERGVSIKTLRPVCSDLPPSWLSNVFRNRPDLRRGIRDFSPWKFGAISMVPHPIMNPQTVANTRRVLWKLTNGLLPHDTALENPLAVVNNFGSILVANSSFSTGFSGFSGLSGQ